MMLPVFLFRIIPILLLLVSTVTPDSDKIQFKVDKLTMDMGGKCVQENYFSNNLNLFNADVIADTTFMMRTTMDYFLSMAYGESNPSILCYNAMRFRFRWGTNSDTRSGDSKLTIVDTGFTVPGTTTNKHLLWLRESWLKIKLGDSEPFDNFIQIGLIPYQVGRGISLGAAYDAKGFITFIPGSAIDQYAPAVLFSLNPIANRLVTDFYISLTKNDQLSLASNIEKVRTNEIGACPQRGVGRQSFIVALRADVLAYEKDKHKVDVEPYFIHRYDPDVNINFANDTNTTISTAGCSVEGVFKRFNWGIEGACNFGDLDIRPWDRNSIIIAKDSNAFLVEQYTKIYTQNPATTKNPNKAYVTTDIANFLKTIPLTTAYNGKLLGVVDTHDIYQAYDRIRPEQARIFNGFFVTGDATYTILPKELEVSLGVGYASGHSDLQLDNNILTREQLMSLEYNGFVPIQSVYSGKRLRHFIAFAQGLPRFSVQNPAADLSKTNVVGLQNFGVVNQFTNISFIGTRIEWKPHQYASNALNLSPNIIGYWAPNSSQFVLKDGGLRDADNYLGLEMNLEFSMYFYQKLKLSGYVGAFAPGQHYKDMCGTNVPAYGYTTGADTGYAGNINVAYLF